MSTADELKPSFRGGSNIAMKVPPAEFDATLLFYRDVVGLPQSESHRPDIVFQFGSSLLWLDRAPELQQTEIWLELLTSDTTLAAEHLSRSGVERCDSVEKLPPGFDGFWVRSPASIVHLITG
ncbi:MAG: hypothetical protein HS117_22445 [Verrucomicrobiaceae bacterium]|nr:hypothetical protein [Verrucomicrobiaceae bacterium]